MPASDEVDGDAGGTTGATVGWVDGALAGSVPGGGELVAAPAPVMTGVVTTATLVDMPTLASAADTTDGDASAVEMLAAAGVVALAP